MTHIKGGKIIAHIVGMSNTIKETFIANFKTFPFYETCTIVDLDEITMQIITEKNMIVLYTKLDDLQNKKKNNKQLRGTMNNTIKDIEKKINEYWKSKIDNYLLNELNKHKNIICIGLATYFKNHKIGIKIITPIKLFIKLNLFENARLIITENLDNNRNEIINGEFDLNYLDINFLVKKREDLQYTYEKMNYQLKKYNDICKIIQLGMQNVVPDGLFFIHTSNLTKQEMNKKKNIVGYTSDWLAIISILKNDIIKGYKNDVPYIQENKPNVFEKLKEPLYLFYTSDITSFMPDITKSNSIYKYISTKNISKFTSILLDNPYNKLKQLNIKLILFKHN